MSVQVFLKNLRNVSISLNHLLKIDWNELKQKEELIKNLAEITKVKNPSKFEGFRFLKVLFNFTILNDSKIIFYLNNIFQNEK